MLKCQGGCGWKYDEYFYVEYEYVQYIICRSCRDRMLREFESYKNEYNYIGTKKREQREQLLRELDQKWSRLPLLTRKLTRTSLLGAEPILKSESSYFETVTYPKRRKEMELKLEEVRRREAEEAKRQAEEAKRQAEETKRQAEETKRQAEETEKRRAEEAEIARLENLLLSKISLSALSLDQRKKLAKSSKRKDVLFRFVFDNKEVVNLLKTNPYITEEDIVRAKQKNIIVAVLVIIISVFIPFLISFLIFGGS